MWTPAAARERPFVRAADDVERQAVGRPASGTQHVIDAAATPGIRADALERQARRLVDDGGVLVPRSRQRRAHDRARSRSCSPGRQPSSESDVRINSEAPTSSTTARLTSTSTSTERVLFWRKPLPERLLESLMTAFRSGARCDERRDQAEQNAGHDRQRDREHARCANPCRAASRAWPSRGKPAVLTVSSTRMPTIARDEAERAARERQHQALGQQLAHDAPAPGAERGAHGELARAAPCARINSRFATFAHAISSTKPTAPSATSSVGRAWRTSDS